MNVLSAVMHWARQLGWALLMSLGLTALAAGQAKAQSRSCYPNGVPAPIVAQTTVTLIDLTTPAGETFDGLLAHLLSQPAAGRHVVLSFSALGGGEQLRKVFDAVLPATPTAEQQRTLPVRLVKAIQRCVQQEATQFPSALEQAMRRVRAKTDGQEYKRSEVLHALHEALSAFTGTPGQVSFYVYSDGLQNGEGPKALSFYNARGAPRTIDFKRELARLPESIKTLHARTTPLQLTWVGLGLQPSTSRHVSPQALQSWKNFWHELLVSYWNIPEPAILQSLISSR